MGDLVARMSERFQNGGTVKSPGATGGPPGDPDAELREEGSPAAVSAGELVEDIYTLSPVQQGMLFHILSSSGDGLYFDQTVCTVAGDLDESAFLQAWEEVVDRHPSLRTSFIWDGLSKPVQVVHRRVSLDFRLLDWRRVARPNQKSRFDALLEEDRNHGLDLAQPPLLRIHLIRLGSERRLLLWSVSHLVADGWCSAILLDEVVDLYEARRRGERPRLPPRVPYRDYVAWLKRQDLAPAERYWKRIFQGLKGSSEVAPDIPPRLGGPEANFLQEGLALTRELSDSLRERARSWQLTLNTVVQGAWALLLSLEAQTDDVVYGVTVSGRSAAVPGIESMIGLLVNTLPLRIPVEPETPLEAWLQRLQRAQVEMREFEHSPLNRVQAWAGLEPGRALFDSIFVFLNAFDPRRHDTGHLELESLRHLSRPHYSISLQVVPARRLRLDFVYAAGKYRWSRVCNWLATLRLLLETMAREPSVTLGDLLERGGSLLTERSRLRRRRRRDSNSDSLRDTRPVPLKLEGEE